ncbi:hypothetical protein NKR23_g2382 [Pleurostoma richardsiae]|uniref:Uncharacterized protein n=1 Tax=Pleurostoma richardsiae TaxID=41990 RepID=A0AA38VVQ3_9PEZI|nr:hypothetical protein NKR23_g2382 [Pleurostoma richardsiae]
MALQHGDFQGDIYTDIVLFKLDMLADYHLQMLYGLPYGMLRRLVVGLGRTDFVTRLEDYATLQLRPNEVADMHTLQFWMVMFRTTWENHISGVPRSQIMSGLRELSWEELTGALDREMEEQDADQ